MVERLVITGGRVVDGVADTPRDRTAVVIEGDRVVELRDGSLTDAESEGAEVIDVAGATVLPGLIDAHVHLVGWRTVDHATFLSEPRELRTIRATADVGTLLRHGFTTVRDLGSADGIHLREAVREGTIAGPRIVTADRMICQTAGNGDTMVSVPTDRLDEIGWLATVADGVDECRRVVRRLVRRGADLIKLCTSGGGASVRGGPHEVQFTREEVRAITDEAHRMGRMVAAHAHGVASIRHALEAGVDTLEHGSYIDDECCRRMVEAGIPLVATIVNIEAFARAAEGGGVPDVMRHRAREELRRKAESLMRAYGNGVTIVHGSDTGGAPPARHGINARNLALFVEAGMPPMEALLTATRNAAAALGLGDRIGTLEAGKLADLVVFDGDLLRDIGAVADPARIVLVVKDGKVVHRRQPIAVAEGAPCRQASAEGAMGASPRRRGITCPPKASSSDSGSS